MVLKNVSTSPCCLKDCTPKKCHVVCLWPVSQRHDPTAFSPVENCAHTCRKKQYLPSLLSPPLTPVLRNHVPSLGENKYSYRRSTSGASVRMPTNYSCGVQHIPENHSVCFCLATGIFSGFFHRHHHQIFLFTVHAHSTEVFSFFAQFDGSVHIKPPSTSPLIL